MAHTVDTDYDVNRAEAVPKSGRVRHFDELDERAQDYLVHVAEGASPRDPTNLSGLREGDVVVFTEYYRIE
ncbi:hypothetical protein [Haloplanus sp. C73]|jgi:hypothetical protein|uniref:hypothetical protein n=1 Tax=Haloplanus sp. C73 TaxID=3421641 RepID=UPI003EC0D69B